MASAHTSLLMCSHVSIILSLLFAWPSMVSNPIFCLTFIIQNNCNPILCWAHSPARANLSAPVCYQTGARNCARAKGSAATSAVSLTVGCHYGPLFRTNGKGSA